MTNHLKEWMGKGFWFLSTSLCDDMVVEGIYNINSLCFKNGKIGIRLFISLQFVFVCVDMCLCMLTGAHIAAFKVYYVVFFIGF